MTVVWSHDIGDAMSPRTNLHVAGHLRVRLPASAPTPGSPRRRRTLRRRGLEKSAQPGTQPLSGESEKWAKTASKSSLSSVDD